jgi:hypothetical protein
MDVSESPATAGPRPPDLRLGAPTPRVAFVIIAGVALVALLYAGRDILAPFVLGLFLVFLLDPPVSGSPADRAQGVSSPPVTASSPLVAITAAP